MRTCLLALLLLLAPASWAQDTETGLEGTTPLTADEETLTTPAATPTSEAVSEAMLTSFVASLLQIQPLLEEASTALLATDSDAERQEIKQRFENRAIAIIDTNEITVADYRRLINLANSDATFTQRVAAEIDRQQASQTPAEMPEPEGP